LDLSYDFKFIRIKDKKCIDKGNAARIKLYD